MSREEPASSKPAAPLRDGWALQACPYKLILHTGIVKVSVLGPISCLHILCGTIFQATGSVGWKSYVTRLPATAQSVALLKPPVGGLSLKPGRGCRGWRGWLFSGLSQTGPQSHFPLTSSRTVLRSSSISSTLPRWNSHRHFQIFFFRGLCTLWTAARRLTG